MKKRYLVLLSLVVAALLSGCEAVKKSPYPEVAKYLENRYERKFEIEEISDEGTIYYSARPEDRPELEFKVVPVGTDYTNAGFDDTYPTVFVLNEAGKLGLSLEAGEGDKELVASIDGYAQIEALSETLSSLAAAYAEAGLPAHFTSGTVKSGWNCADIRVDIRTPELEGYEPAVIHIPDSRQISDSHINDSERIRERIESDYVAYICRYYLGDPLDYLTQDAVTAFYADADGLTVKTTETMTEYPNLSMSLNFAELYRLAEEEGWNPSIAQNSFSITANEQTSWFFLEFEEAADEGAGTTARVYWEAEETGERLPAWGDYDYTPEIIDWHVIEERTGCSFSRGLLLQEDNERKEKNKAQLNEFLNSGTLTSLGSSVEIGNWAVTVTDAEETGRISGGSMYFEADSGKAFVRVDMNIVNQGTERVRFLPTVITSDDLMVQLATSGGLQYSPVALLGGGDMTGSALEAGESKSGFIVFHVSQELMETEEHLLLLLSIGNETKAVQIK